MVKLKITVVIVKRLFVTSHSPMKTGVYLEKDLKKQCGFILTDSLLYVENPNCSVTFVITKMKTDC